MSASKPPEMSKTEPGGADYDPGNSFQSFLRAIKNKPKKNTYVKRVGPSGAEMLSSTRKEYVSGLARSPARSPARSLARPRLTLDSTVGQEGDQARESGSDAACRDHEVVPLP
jgi:hypothetical protein